MERISEPSSEHQGARYQQILSKCRAEALGYFAPRIGELFADVEPVLLDFADKSESNRIHIQILEAINLIKMHRPKVQDHFQKSIKSGFDQFDNGEKLFDTTAVEAGTIDKLQLDDMDENVTIENIISRTRNSCYQEIYAMGQRLSLIRGGKKLKEHNLPSGPYHLAKSFQQASKLIPVKSDIRIILMKHNSRSMNMNWWNI